MSSDEAEIRGVIDTWMHASMAGDLETVLGLMSEDVVFLLPGQPPMRGREAFAKKFRGGPARMKLEGHSDIQELRVDGDHAYCWNQLSITITPEEGAVVKRSGPVLTVFRREADEKWRLFRDANLLTVE